MSQPSEKQTLRVLLVEDSKSARAMVRQSILNVDANIELEEAVDLASAFEALRRNRFDCALVDYRLPDGDGLALLAELRAQGGCETPIVILTALNDEATAMHALQVGAQDYVVKNSKLDGHLVLRSIRYAIERKRAAALQLQLLQVDRMVALGTLAAGVAHEINNPLAYVTANLTFMGDRLAQLAESSDGATLAVVQELQELTAEMRIGTDRVRRVVRDLRSYTRPDDPEGRRSVQLEPVLEQAISMAWNDIRHRARLVRSYQPAPPVEANDARLGQVFLNLLINAAQAIPEGHATKNEIQVAVRAAPPGRVEVVIRDTGPGIPPDVVGRIFDPFFTTKPVGSGTGLGLFICEGIVRGIGGEILVESEVGKGTTLRVLLPAAAPPAGAEPAPPPPRPSRRSRGAAGHARILVIDDEPLVLLSMRRLLEPGHTLVTTTRAADALRRIGEGERFDLIIADLMMPEMTGMELHAELLRTAPALAQKMLFITGAFTPVAQQFLARVPNLRIEKPFDAQELRDLIASMV